MPASDFAAIRRLLDADPSPGVCPNCSMPFDKGKKRRLIDNCGHERCYSCMFTNESCPLCTNDVPIAENDIDLIRQSNQMGCAHLRGSEITLYGEIGDSVYGDKCDKSQLRTKVKTNGHFTNFMKNRDIYSINTVNEGNPEKLPKTRPVNSKIRTEQQQNGVVQRCQTPPAPRRKFFLSPKALRSPIGQKCAKQLATDPPLSDDERRTVTQPSPTAITNKNKPRDSDMYMRLGLLLGDTAARRPKKSYQDRLKHESCSSLASYETAAVLSTNTSPVSTLTGSSEEQQRCSINPSSESVGSLMSMSMSGHSNCSSSPLSRRHSVTTTSSINHHMEDLTTVLHNRRTCLRRSERSSSSTVKGVVSVNPRIRFAAQYRHTPQLALKPLFFEVPLQEPDPLFVGRHWLIKAIEDVMASSATSGVLLSGNSGTGKTAFILQLVEYSCFGRRHRRKEPSYDQNDDTTASERIRQLAGHVVAYHFCQADNNSTCLVPDFVHSLAAQLCQAPQLAAYREHLLSEQHLQSILSLKECIANPDVALVRGIIEPLLNLRKSGKIESNLKCILLVDALCEAEYHRPDNGDTVATFLAKHVHSFPTWLTVIATVRTQLQEAARQLPFSRISLNISCSGQKDLSTYLVFRLQNSPTIQNNITNSSVRTSSTSSDSSSMVQHKFCQHLLALSQGSFLFAKLTLDLLERGHLVAKSSNYKVLPVTLAQIYSLHFNLRFPTVRSFDKVAQILNVCLAALYPLSLEEIFYSVNSLLVSGFLTWDEFLQRFKMLGGFLVKRLDDTYMFFHPSFREWLIRRDPNEDDDSKFLCDLRAGHSAIAFRLSRTLGALNGEHTLELGHHILKAHLYRNSTALAANLAARDLQAHWICSSSEDISEAISHIRNIYNPNLKVSRLLLLAGASANHCTSFLGDAPLLCLYASEGNLPMVSLLLEFGANVELTNSQGSTALLLASAKGHCDVVRQLIAAGANPAHVDTGGNCALIHAARNGCLNVVGYLLACDWLKQSNDDIQLVEAAQQALIEASGEGHVDIVEYLLDMAEAHVDHLDQISGETALTMAALHGTHNVVAALLSRGANPAIGNRKNAPPLHVAVKEGHWSVAKLLLELTPDKNYMGVEQVDPLGRTALMIGAAEGHFTLVELLLCTGADIIKEDHEGMTALCWACLRGKLTTAQCLIEGGANVNHSDRTGRSALDLAAFHGNVNLVEFLLEHGAVIEHVDLNGMRPLDRAIGCRNVQVVQCFLKKGAKLGPATWAMATGKSDILLILLNKLLEDGNTLYRKGRLKEATHRYQYALKKFPHDEEVDHNKAFQQLQINFLLNYSRCKRKLNVNEEAIELANKVLKLNPDSYEAYYALVKAKFDLKLYESASEDIREALRLVPAQNVEVRKVLKHLGDEIVGKLAQNSSLRLPLNASSTYRNLAISVDTLHG